MVTMAVPAKRITRIRVSQQSSPQVEADDDEGMEALIATLRVRAADVSPGEDSRRLCRAVRRADTALGLSKP